MFRFLVYILIRGIWPAITVVAFDTFLNYFFDSYRVFPDIDIPMHLLGGAAVAYFFWMVLKAPNSEQIFKNRSPRSVFTFLILGTFTITIFWECFEWFADTYWGAHSQKGTMDTITDMITGVIGALPIAWYVSKRKLNSVLK